MTEDTTGVDAGSVRPSEDPSDEALLDKFGFGGDTKDSSPPVADQPPASGSKEEDVTSLPSDLSFGPREQKPSQQPNQAPTQAPAQPQSPEGQLSQALKGAEKVTPKFTDPKANHAFAELRHQNTELSKTVEELQKQLLEKTNTLPEIEKIRSDYETKVKDLEEQLGQYDLASTEGFRRKYDASLNGILGRVLGMLQKSGLSEEDSRKTLDQIRTLGTVQRAQSLNEIVPALSGPVVNLMEDFDDLLMKRETELRNWRESKSSMAEEEKRIKKSRAFEEADAISSSVIEELRGENNPFYTESKEDARWNSRVSDRISKLKGLLKTGDSAVLARLVAEGLASQEYRNLYLLEARKRKELEESMSTRGSLRGTPSNMSSSSESYVDNGPVEDEQLLTNLGF